MYTVSLRNLRGKDLRESLLKGTPLVVTNRDVLIGFFIPVEADWVRHLIDFNWSQVSQSIVEGERSLSTALVVAVLDGMIAEGDAIGYKQGQASTPSASAAGRESMSANPSVITVRLGDLTALLIEETGARAQSLAVTYNRKLIGTLVPVTWNLVSFLIEQNLSRILYNIGLSEKHITTSEKMITLDETFYREESLIEKVERIAASFREELDRLPTSQQLSIIAKHFPQTEAAYREIAGDRHEVAMEFPTLGLGGYDEPGFKADRSDPVISTGGSVESDTRKVFLCHSSSDKPRVRALRRSLLDGGIEPWFDEEDILPGQDWELEIRKAIRASDVVLVCLSRTSVSKVGYLQKEIKHVLDVADEQPEGTIFLIPVRLEPCEVPERLCRWQWVDLFEEAGYPRLLRALRNRNSD